MLVIVFSILAFLLFVGLVLVILVIGIYNRLHGLRTRCDGALTQLLTHTKRRCDLVSQLADRLSALAGFDQSIVVVATDGCRMARTAQGNAARNPHDREALVELFDAEERLGDAVRQLEMNVESHEQIAADERVAALQSELNATHSRLHFAQETFHDLSGHYNTQRNQFPARLFAGRLGFGAIPIFDIGNK